MRWRVRSRFTRSALAASLACCPLAAWAGDNTGTALSFSSYIEMEGGFDTNPDSLVRHDGTSLGKVELGGRIGAKRLHELYELSYRARGAKFEELEISNRWDGRVALDMTFDLSPQQELKIGGSYLRDFFSLNRADVVKSYLDHSYKADDFRIRLQGKSHIEQNVERNEGVSAGTLDTDIFDTIRGRAFDYSKTEGQFALLTFTRSWLQPFFIYNYADVNYFHQADNPIVDRNAVDQFGIAGVRLDMDKSFRIDLGGRLNSRDFDDVEVSHFTRAFYDVNLVWNPTGTFKVKAVAERLINEPSTAFGLADDVKSYGLTVDWKATDKLRLVVSGYYDRVVPIGDEFAFNKYTLTASSTYELATNLDWFVSGLAKWVDDDVTGQRYTRYKLGSGIRMKF